MLTSKDTNLTKAHARYLESRFLTLAVQAGRARLTNGTNPPPIVLPEADVSDMEYFVEQAKIVLPVLGVNIFRAPTTAPAVADEETVARWNESPVFEMTLRKFGITARAREVDGEFTVLEGSGARLTWTGAESHSYTSLRSKLEQDGTLVSSPDGSSMRFIRNHVFASPSAAAAIVAGRSANGRKEWVIEGRRTSYGEWETEGIDAAMTQGA